MEAETKLPAPQVKAKITNHMPSSIKDSPHPAPSSSLKTSSPDFLRHVQAAFKRRRPINSSQPSNLMPRRIMLPQRETPKNADNSLFLKAHETQEDASITPPSDSGTMTDTYEVNRNQKPFTTCKAGNSNETQEDASITPPSDLGTMTNKFQHIPLVEGSRKVCPSAESNSTAREGDDQMTTGTTNLCSHMDSLALAETEWDNINQAEPANMTHNEENLHVSQHLDVDRGLRSDGVSSSFGDRRSNLQDQLHHLQNFLHSDGTHPMTQSSVCATSISVHATSAPGPSLTTICSSHLEQPHGRMAQQSHLSANLSTTHNTNCATMVAQASTSGVPVDSMKETHQVPKERNVSKFSSICNQEPMKGTECAGAVLDAQSEGIPANSSSLDVKNEPSTREKRAKPETEKGGKPTRKKNYDPDMFFKVNGKLYQRLGKIGTGGSSEVHKVISSDCKIYALKKIKLKGRDYATAYGFCQEILYLNRLQGKNNIIQLIDYEVTDKALLEEVMKDSISNKDARVKDDGYIYMVLEYGEIDLAHMLSQKWKDMETSSETIDENWLRFYWQQILQAVNTIHEERIVHSDLKPANFLLVKGSLKLIDFGIAKSIMSDTTNIQRDAQVGTLSYMSPEAFMCNECDQNGNVIKCGRASDIWSLGCILYQMVYGRTPFADYKTFWAKFKVITDPNHEITYDAVSNPWLIDLMSKCLAWDRNKRWRIPELLQHPFLVPPAPTYIPSEPNQNYKAKAIQWIAESHANSKVSALCSQLQQLLAENPESREEQCELLTRILDVGSQLREQII